MASLLSCPKCNNFYYYQSRQKNVIEIIRSKLFFQNVYRCHECGFRGWVFISVKFPKISKRQITIISLIFILSFLFSYFLTR